MITLDDRSLLIFKELLVSPRIKGKDLEKKLNLTRRQINYSIQKINDWLADNSLPIIENQRNVGFIVDRSIIERVPELLQIRPALEYIPTKKERMNLLLLMILARREELSLFHLASALKVSKNTVLYDLHLMEKKLKERQLALKYTRRDGYFIEGKEIAKRKLIVDTVNKILHMP
ncbi:MAG: transcription antiterminator BglG, partial [Bacillaceae bacterium]|nr:transcription antiterminator BglG [Bacillaceae bacterium]